MRTDVIHFFLLLCIVDCAAEGGVYYKEGGGPEEDEGEDGVGRSGGVVDEVEPQGSEDGCAGKPGGAEYPTGCRRRRRLGQAVHYLARKEGVAGVAPHVFAYECFQFLVVHFENFC